MDSKNSTVTWSATIGPSADGKAYMGISTRGSTGGSSEKRALDQVGPLKQQLSSKGYQDITPITFDGKDHFVNPSGNKIHQYFFKYTDPNKYPPHPTKGGLNVDNTNTSLTTKFTGNPPGVGGYYKITLLGGDGTGYACDFGGDGHIGSYSAC